MLVTGWGGEHPRLLPDSRDREYQRPPKSLPRSVGHHQEWIDACKTGSATRSNFVFAGPLTEAVLLGSVCICNGGDKLVWNTEKMEFTNDPDANKFLDYEHRDGWKL
jgi:hypothetical protein